MGAENEKTGPEEQSYGGPERRAPDHRRERLVLGILIVTLIVAVTVNVISFVQTRRINDNTDALRTAGYENCVRGNGPIAEQQFRTKLTPPEVIDSLVKQLGLDQSVADATTIEALRDRLPIFDCAPLLSDKPAREMTAAEQDRYVEDFAHGRVVLPAP